MVHTLQDILTREVLSTPEIELVVSHYKDFFANNEQITIEELNIVDALSEDQSNHLSENIISINRCYSVGLISKVLNKKTEKEYNPRAFDETGHNERHVKPLKGIEMKFM